MYPYIKEETLLPKFKDNSILIDEHFCGPWYASISTLETRIANISSTKVNPSMKPEDRRKWLMEEVERLYQLETYLAKKDNLSFDRWGATKLIQELETYFAKKAKLSDLIQQRNELDRQITELCK